ncbi:MAG TPA: type II toxin-antitoxin system VapC family toxin [Leucothrix sp.]|nr:type II toxin-antitoxin system VapC family toxin [Leucothrix sp.]HIQ14065.1 type II toxin-antitoxin system VapC family toxin [Leucothrix sp.]
MVALIDTNVIIRFLVGDHEEHLLKSTEIFENIESRRIEVKILDTVLMEVLFVLIKFYKLPKAEVVNDLKSILAMEGIVNTNKVILVEALTLHLDKNIDFVDALICAKSKIQGYGWISFDNDLKKCK